MKGDGLESPSGRWIAAISRWTYRYPPILPLTGSAETPFPFAPMMGAILLGLGLVVRGPGGRHCLRSK